MSKETDLGRSTFTSVIVMACTLLSRLLGFVRLVVITTFFSQSKADVINFAFSIPNNLRKLLAEGALSSAFIPVLSANLVETPDGSNARDLVSSILSFQVLVILPLCLIGVFFSDTVIHVLSDFDDASQIDAASRLFKLVINYFLLISISAVFMGVLNSHRRFLVPAITPILFSIAVIGSVTLLRDELDIYAMALGVLLGGIAQILFQYPLFHRLGYRFRFRLDFKNSEFRKIMVRWLPILATSSVFALTQQIAFAFASGLEAGSVTAVTIAITFFQLPFGIFSASITNVLYPRMSSQSARKDYRGLTMSLQYGLRFLVAALLPSAVFLCIMSEQVISVAFLKGEFTMDNVRLASPVLIYYTVGLLSVGAFTFMQRVFYSLEEYRVPFLVALMVSVADIILSLFLKETVLRTGGIALANSISFTLGAILLVVLMRKKLTSFIGGPVACTAFKVTLSTLPAAVALLAFNHYLGPWWTAGRSAGGFLLVLAGAAVYSCVVLGGFALTKVEMLEDLKARFRRRSV